MRIQGVTGDLPAVAQLISTVPAADAPVEAAAPPAVAAAAAGAKAGGGQTASDRHRPRPPLPAFDPPLIAQRAVLGWPVGPLIAEHARAEGISYTAARAQVDRAMPADTGTRAAPPAA